MFTEFFASSLLGLWLKTAHIVEPPLPSQSATLRQFVLQPMDPQRDQLIDVYLANLERMGMKASEQGLWLQTDSTLLVDHQGQQLQTPASLTKIATTLAALKTWGPNHQFKTTVWTTGSLQNDILTGDLHIQGEGDPLFVTTEAISLGNQINALGIHRVSGNLILSGSIPLNLETDPQTVGETLKVLWNAAQWNPSTESMYQWMPKRTPKPQLVIEGAIVHSAAQTIPSEKRLISHSSLPLSTLLKMMNVYSNNRIAEALTGLMGGPEKLKEVAMQTGKIAPQEILLSNGSGLGQDNKLSPRAVVGLFQSVQDELKRSQLTLADIFPVMGEDQGTVKERQMPATTIVKTGTLWNTSGIAGILQTQRYGPVWFALMNHGNDFTDGFRSRQDQLLKGLAQYWGESGMSSIRTTASTDLVTSQRRQLIEHFMQDDFLSH